MRKSACKKCNPAAVSRVNEWVANYSTSVVASLQSHCGLCSGDKGERRQTWLRKPCRGENARLQHVRWEAWGSRCAGGVRHPQTPQMSLTAKSLLSRLETRAYHPAWSGVSLSCAYLLGARAIGLSCFRPFYLSLLHHVDSNYLLKQEPSSQTAQPDSSGRAALESLLIKLQRWAKWSFSETLPKPTSNLWVKETFGKILGMHL